MLHYGQCGWSYHVEVNLFPSSLACDSSKNEKCSETYMMHLLVSNGSVVLKNIVIGGSSSCH
jgi:hypothetical protein